MNELFLRAESLFHYLEPVRLAIFFYKTFCWLIKLPGRAVSAYREARDGFRFLRDLPQRMVEDFMRVVLIGLVAAVGTALSAVAAKFLRPVVVIGLVALVGTALFVAAKGTARVAS